MFIGEADTGEPFSIGLKLGKTTYYLKAENRLELDNWSRVLKPFVQASQAFVPRRGSSSSSDSDVFVQGELPSLHFKPKCSVTLLPVCYYYIWYLTMLTLLSFCQCKVKVVDFHCKDKTVEVNK